MIDHKTGNDLILSNQANYQKGRDGDVLNRLYFHRTAVKGDTARGEANYFQSHVLIASAGVFIDLEGNIEESVPDSDTAYAVNELDENHISYSIEFTGMNGTPLTLPQINSAIKFIKSDSTLTKIPNHRLTLTEIPPRKAGGYGNHFDVTLAYNIKGGHVDGITNAEISAILKGVYAK